MQKKWWKEGVVYQIYPRSFNDSDGDGIGDIQGIIQKLDYIQDLGVDIVWLSPIYKSPNDDNGYDISDYCDIMDEFGTMADFDALLEGMHARGLKLVMDLVVNHSSDDHLWFQEARKSTDNPYRDYYIWKKSDDGNPPNDWPSFFGGSAWTWDETTGEHYLHYFSKKQPDLNWENPKLRHEIYNMMRFWLDKGVDGFRMDVITLISKDRTWKNLDGRNHAVAYADGPRIHDYLQEMHREVLQHYDVMTVGEAVGMKLENALDYVAEDRKELNMTFHFDFWGIGRDTSGQYMDKPWTASGIQAIVDRWDNLFENEGWPSLYLGNHDVPRMVSRFGNDTEYHKESAKLLLTFLLTGRGTPYIYNGDEFGMTNYPFEDVSDLRDIEAINFYTKHIESESKANILERLRTWSRDNARTPMQWDDTTHAGFTAAQTPWMQVNPNYKAINQAAAEENPDSILNYFKEMIKLRKENRVLQYGSYRSINTGNEFIYTFTRSLDDVLIVVLLNFSDREQSCKVKLEGKITGMEVLISNITGPEMDIRSDIQLSPFQATVLKGMVQNILN